MEPVLHNKRGRDSERPAQRDEERPQLEKALAQKRRPNTAKKKKKKKKTLRKTSLTSLEKQKRKKRLVQVHMTGKK